MKVNVHAVNFNIDKKLNVFIEERVSKLLKYYDRLIDADAYLKLDNNHEKENKVVELKIHVPGDEFLVKKQGKKFEEAVDSAVESLERLLLKRKEKIRTHI